MIFVPADDSRSVYISQRIRYSYNSIFSPVIALTHIISRSILSIISWIPPSLVLSGDFIKHVVISHLKFDDEF